MLKRLQTIRDTMNRNIFVGERLNKNLQSMSNEAVIVFFLGLVMFAVNIAQGDYNTALSPLAFLIVSLISYYFAKVKKWRMGSVIATSVVVVLVFTYDILVVSNGFAFLWTLLIPLSCCYMFGIKEGIVITLYFQLLYTLAFYTPARHMMEGHFSEIVMDRFPLLYFFNGIITIFVMYEYHKSVLFEIDSTEHLNKEVERQTKVATDRADKLERLSTEMVETLAKTIDAKDRYTNGHSFRVSKYATAIADRLGWSEEEQAELQREALLHDIGKIGVPDAVLNKPDRLTDKELEAIRAHTVTGETILDGLEDMDAAAQVAMRHHERYDGYGYPSGLKGKEIPAHARVVAIGDAYDAMHSDRVYRKALPRETIRQELVSQRGRQFDPDFLDVFLGLMDSGELDRLEAQL